MGNEFFPYLLTVTGHRVPGGRTSPSTGLCSYQPLAKRKSLAPGQQNINRAVTSWKTNMSPENLWLEDVFPIEIYNPFLGGYVSFRGCTSTKNIKKYSFLDHHT